MESEIDACEQMTSWEQIYQAETIHGSTAVLAQNEESGPQVFYAVRCRSEFSPCRGIKAGIVSRCETRFNPTTAIVVDKSAPNGIRWEVVLIAGQCVCTESFVNLTNTFT
uniref:Nerve growth factor-related domain-containing protein n=1 Tax=Panagrolaimus sp. JU765 TaxID=591449 RepID=A0AC34PV17_9BILA